MEPSVVKVSANNEAHTRCPHCKRVYDQGPVKRMQCKPCKHFICIACSRQAVHKWSRGVPLQCKVCETNIESAVLDSSSSSSKQDPPKRTREEEEEDDDRPEKSQKQKEPEQSVVEEEEEEEEEEDDDDQIRDANHPMRAKRELDVATGGDDGLECLICASMFDNQQRCPYRVVKYRDALSNEILDVREQPRPTCGHTFCEPCALRHVEQPCPVCRSHIYELDINVSILRKVVKRDGGRYVALVTAINELCTTQADIEKLKVDAKRLPGLEARLILAEKLTQSATREKATLQLQMERIRAENAKLFVEQATNRTLRSYLDMLFQELIELRLLATERGILDPTEVGLQLQGSGPNGEYENVPGSKITVEVDIRHKPEQSNRPSFLSYTRNRSTLSRVDLNVLKQIDEINAMAEDNIRFVPDRQQLDASILKLPNNDNDGNGGEVLVRTGTWLHRTIKSFQSSADQLFANANFDDKGGADGVCVYERTNQDLVDKAIVVHRDATIAKERGERMRAALTGVMPITSMHDVCISCFKHFRECSLESNPCGSCTYNRCNTCKDKPLLHSCTSGFDSVGPLYGIPLAGPRSADATLVATYMEWLYDAFVCQNKLSTEPVSPDKVATAYIRYLSNNGIRHMRLHHEKRAWLVSRLSKLMKTLTTAEDDTRNADIRIGTMMELAKLWTHNCTVSHSAQHLQELLQTNIDVIARTIRSKNRFSEQDEEQEEDNSRPSRAPAVPPLPPSVWEGGYSSSAQMGMDERRDPDDEQQFYPLLLDHNPDRVIGEVRMGRQNALPPWESVQEFLDMQRNDTTSRLVTQLRVASRVQRRSRDEHEDPYVSRNTREQARIASLASQVAENVREVQRVERLRALYTEDPVRGFREISGVISPPALEHGEIWTDGATVVIQGPNNAPAPSPSPPPPPYDQRTDALRQARTENQFMRDMDHQSVTVSLPVLPPDEYDDLY